MKRRGLFCFAIFASLAFARADQLLGWDFAGLLAAPDTPAVISATVGTGTLDISAFATSERTALAGSTLNGFPGGDQTAGMSLTLQNASANGKSALFSFDMTGWQDLMLSFATRGTGTGFSTHEWAWSTDGTSYTALSGNNTAVTGTTFLLKEVDFSGVTALNDAPGVFIRLTVDDATGGLGNNRFDNILFSASPVVAVPEPAGLLAFGGVGLLALQFWRRRAEA